MSAPGASRVWLLAAAALALALRLHGLGLPGPWLDEVHSLANSAARRAELERLPRNRILDSNAAATCLQPSTGAADVWRGMRSDTHPPAYFELLWLWRRLVGSRPFQARLLSVLVSLGALLATAATLRALGEASAGSLAAFLMAAAFLPLQMAQNIRPYSLSLALVSAAALALVGLCRAGPRTREWLPWAIGYAAAAYLAVMSHYFAAFGLLGPLLVARRLGPRALHAVGAALAAALAFGLTWGASLAAQAPLIAGQTWLVDASPGHGWRTLLRLASAPVTVAFSAHPGPVLAALGTAAAAVLAAWALRRRSPAALLFAAWAFVPVLILAAIDLATSRQLLVHGRYLCVAAPGFLGLVALALGALPSGPRAAALALLAGGAALTLPLPTPRERPVASPPAVSIGAVVEPGDLLVLGGPGEPDVWAHMTYPVLSYAVDHFETDQACPAPAPVGYLRLAGAPRPELRARLGAFRRLLVVTPSRPSQDPNPLPELFPVSLGGVRVEEDAFVYAFGRSAP